MQAWQATRRLVSVQVRLQAVPDSTGREDLLKALRETLLLRAARSVGAAWLARGDSSSRLAARVIAMSAKGSGYGLPSTLHFLDGRQVNFRLNQVFDA